MYLFTRRANGQTIDAAHVNELQIAIEVFSHRTYNVRTYGAIGDSIANDTAAIQAAIDAAAAAGGGLVLIPSGTYAVNQIVIKTRVHVRGAGHRVTILKLRNGQNTSVVKPFVSPDAIQSNAFWWTLSDLTIDGNAANQTSSSSHGLELTMNPIFDFASNDLDFDPDWRIDRVSIWNCKGSGVYQRGRSMGVAHAVWCENNDRYGFEFNIGSDTALEACVASMSGLCGFGLFGSGPMRMISCKSYWNGRLDGNNGHGFIISSNSHVNMLVCCEAQDNKGEGFRIENTRSNVLVGCAADSNSVQAPWGWSAYGLWNTQYNAIIGSICVERFPSGQQGQTTGTQRYALQARMGGGATTHNQIDLTHAAINGATVDGPVQGGSDAITGTGNRIFINGVQQTANVP